MTLDDCDRCGASDVAHLPRVPGRPWYCASCRTTIARIDEGKSYTRTRHYTLYETAEAGGKRIRGRNVSLEMPSDVVFPKVLEVLEMVPVGPPYPPPGFGTPAMALKVAYDRVEEWLGGRPYRTYYVRRQ